MNMHVLNSFYEDYGFKDTSKSDLVQTLIESITDEMDGNKKATAWKVLEAVDHDDFAFGRKNTVFKSIKEKDSNESVSRAMSREEILSFKKEDKDMYTIIGEVMVTSAIGDGVEYQRYLSDEISVRESALTQVIGPILTDFRNKLISGDDED